MANWIAFAYQGIAQYDARGQGLVEHAGKEPVEGHLTSQTMQINAVTTRPVVEPRRSRGASEPWGKTCRHNGLRITLPNDPTVPTQANCDAMSGHA